MTISRESRIIDVRRFFEKSIEFYRLWEREKKKNITYVGKFRYKV